MTAVRAEGIRWDNDRSRRGVPRLWTSRAPALRPPPYEEKNDPQCGLIRRGHGSPGPPLTERPLPPPFTSDPAIPVAPSVVFEAPRVPGILLTRRFLGASGLVGDVFFAIISTDRQPPHKEKGTDAAWLAGDFAMLWSRELADQGGGGGLRRNDRAPRCRNLGDFQTSRPHTKIRKSLKQYDARQKKPIPAKEVRVLRLRGEKLRLVYEYLRRLAYTYVGLRKCNFSNICLNFR